MYQKYRIVKAEYEFIPAAWQWRTSADTLNNTTDYNGQAGQTAALFQYYGEFGLVPDQNDGIVRANLDEYFQQKLNPMANIGPIHLRRKVTVVPTVEDIMVNDQAPNGVFATQGTNNGNAVGSNNMFTQADFTTAVVKAMPWMDTHAWNGITQNGTFYNFDQQAFGIKYYVYLPWNIGAGPGPTPQNAAVGILRRYTHYEFKQVETRAPITNIAFSTEEQIAMNTLRKLKGERDNLFGIGGAEFTPMASRLKRLSEEEQEEALKKKAKTYKETLDEYVASHPSNEAPLPSSQQTPQLHQFRAPLGLSKKA